MKKSTFVLFFILISAIFLRFFKLGSVPFGVTHDEIGYIYNSYSLSQTGQNVRGVFLPFLSWMTVGFPYMPGPIYLSAPIFWIFGLSTFSGRMLGAVFGVFDCLILYLLVKKLFNDTTLGLLSAFFLAISPWHILMGRSAYDTNTSAFLFLIGIYFFVTDIKAKRIPIFTSICFFIAVFSYRGMNPVFPGLAILLPLFGWHAFKMQKKQLFFYIIGILIIISTFLFVANKYNSMGYLSEALINQTKMQSEIDNSSREAQGPLFIKRIFLNKPMYILNVWRQNYFDSYSPSYLFLRGERDKTTSYWSRGKLYFIDIFFIPIGIYFLLRKNKKSGLFTIGLLLVSGLPGMIGGPIYASRDYLMSVFFPVFTAAGVLSIIFWFKSKPVKTLVIILISIVYLYSLSSFLFDYFGRFAFENAEQWFKSVKEVSYYIESQKKDFKTVVLGKSSVGELMQYSFYTKINPREVQKSIKSSPDFSNFYLQNIYFTSKCFANQDGTLPNFESMQKPLLYIVRSDCVKQTMPIKIFRDYDGNPIWSVYKVY